MEQITKINSNNNNYVVIKNVMFVIIICQQKYELVCEVESDLAGGRLISQFLPVGVLWWGG